jgi:hypothetical protein
MSASSKHAGAVHALLAARSVSMDLALSMYAGGDDEEVRLYFLFFVHPRGS